MASKYKGILFPTVIILFILEILTLPFVLSLTYATRSQSPEHILTYTDHQLSWDAGTQTDAQGTAKLLLFADHAVNVNAADGANVIAPGTEGSSLVRLKNDEETPIRYTAIAYTIRSDRTLPVAVTLDTAQAAAAADAALPEGIAAGDVIAAVTGSLDGGQMQDFDINWVWKFEESAAQDATDTALGNRAAYGEPDDLIVGMHITVETPEGDVVVSSPQTGQRAVVGGYVVLLCISGLMIVLLSLSPKKETTDET